MNVVDSSAWLSYFTNDTNSKYFADTIENTNNLIVLSIVLSEVFKIVYRQHSEDTALQAIVHFKQAKLLPLEMHLFKMPEDIVLNSSYLWLTALFMLAPEYIRLLSGRKMLILMA